MTGLLQQVFEKASKLPENLQDELAKELLDEIDADSVDFIATDPPYSPELEMTMSGSKANERYDRQNRKSSCNRYRSTLRRWNRQYLR